MGEGYGLERELGRRFVKMYVSDLTRDMGENGKKGLETLFERAASADLIETPPVLTFIS